MPTVPYLYCRNHITPVSSWGPPGRRWGVPAACIWFLRKDKVVRDTPRCFPRTLGADSVRFGRELSKTAYLGAGSGLQPRLTALSPPGGPKMSKILQNPENSENSQESKISNCCTLPPEGYARVGTCLSCLNTHRNVFSARTDTFFDFGDPGIPTDPSRSQPHPLHE